MRARRYIIPVAALGVAIGFVCGVVRLFQLRFEAGDIYPPYSTLRTDPLGCKALYQGLSELRGLSVGRNYVRFRKLTAGRGTTLFHLGALPHSGSLDIHGESSTQPASGPTTHPAKRDEDVLEKFIASGGRLVISLSPRKGWSASDAHDPHGSSFLGLDIREDSKPVRHGEGGLVARRNIEGAGEDALPWHTTLYFAELSPAWRKVYLRDDKPVIIEKDLGAGTIVVCSDSYLFSNEAMRNDRYPMLLAWLVGRSGEVLFDETHLGVVRRGGIAALGREYNLAGLFFVLVFLGGLFIWKNSFSFLPRDEEQDDRSGGEVVSGRSSASGLFNLLRRSIPRRNVLGICLREWQRSARRTRPGFSKVCSRIEAVVEHEKRRPRKERNPALAYRTICRILSERKW